MIPREPFEAETALALRSVTEACIEDPGAAERWIAAAQPIDDGAERRTVRTYRRWMPLLAAAAVIVVVAATATATTLLSSHHTAPQQSVTPPASTATSSVPTQPSLTATPSTSTPPPQPHAAAKPWYDSNLSRFVSDQCSTAIASKTVIPVTGGQVVALQGNCSSSSAATGWVVFVGDASGQPQRLFVAPIPGSIRSVQRTGTQLTVTYIGPQPTTAGWQLGFGAVALFERSFIAAPGAIQPGYIIDITPRCATGALTVGTLVLGPSSAGQTDRVAKDVWYRGPAQPCWIAMTGMSVTLRDGTGHVIRTHDVVTTGDARVYVTTASGGLVFNIAMNLGSASFPSSWCTTTTPPAMIHSIDLTTSWAPTQHLAVPPVYACNNDIGAIAAGTG